MLSQGFQLVTGGTDNHLMLIDLSDREITGKVAEAVLDEAGITVNKNTVPNEKRSPFVTSGVRIGTPALTTRGMGVTEMKQIGKWIAQVLNNADNAQVKNAIHAEVKEMCKHFPIY
jgi:glycine hydroxymethyltransferase